MIIEINRLEFTRAGLEDLLAEADRRQQTLPVGDPKAPPVVGAGEGYAAYAIRLADYLIGLACEQAAVDWFDRGLPRQSRLAAQARIAVEEVRHAAEVSA